MKSFEVTPQHKKYWINLNPKGAPKYCKICYLLDLYDNMAEVYIPEIDELKIVDVDKIEKVEE